VSLIIPWLLFPLVLAAIGAGWGAIAQRAAGTRIDDSLLLPLGLASAIVVAGTLTSFAASAPAATPVVAAGAVAGLVFAWPGRQLHRWPLLAAAGVLLVYGAPVLLSGQATFTGFIKLDDTATWFDVIDNVMAHGHSLAGIAPSTYALVYSGDVGSSYPIGAFMLPGVARALVRTDVAWVFQPYLACCAAALSLCVYALMRPLIVSPRLRALLAFLAAQSALLYGYSLWGGIKELTAAFLLALGVALAAPVLSRRPARARELIPLAIAAGALIVTLGPGGVGWIAPALACILAAWLWRGRRSLAALRDGAISIGWLTALTALFVVPVWIVLGSFLGSGLAEGLTAGTTSTAITLGNLLQPLSAFQLAGIWPVGDFRATAPTVPSALLIGLALVAAAGALWMSARRRSPGVALYVAVALGGCGVVYLAGGTPWVMGKTLAISSPALLTAALLGAGMLYGRRRALGAVVVAILAGGVLWSNALAYHAVTLAPRAPLAELQHIGELVKGKGPTFVNDYEIYADRHFLREGAPVEPAEYRSASLPLRDGTLLTKSAWADIDSFPLSTLEPYRSLVLRRSPTESRPPSIYKLVWQGRYYELWQRPERPATRILEHVPLGESNTLPYCGVAENGPYAALCSVNPVAKPPCTQIQSLARHALRLNADLLAYQRPAPIVARADQTLWPAPWIHDVQARTLTPTTPGGDVAHIAVASSQSYELWLGGSFARGFDVSVDGYDVGRLEDQLSSVDGYVHLANLLLAAGVHTFVLTYPHADLAPGSGLGEFTTLTAIVLQPRQSPASELISVAPQQAIRLCGRPLDWIELVGSA
jgi:hypothetical protein